MNLAHEVFKVRHQCDDRARDADRHHFTDNTAPNGARSRADDAHDSKFAGKTVALVSTLALGPSSGRKVNCIQSHIERYPLLRHHARLFESIMRGKCSLLCTGAPEAVTR